MSKLEEDTRFSGSEGSFEAVLHPDWQIWFPNGGYMATILLRAVGATSAFDQPLSMTCHFVSVPKVGAVTLEVHSQKKTRNAESLSFSMRQGDKVIVHGVAWTGRPVDGYVHDDTVMPAVPHWKTLGTSRDIAEGDAPHPFWKNLEQRPTSGDFYWMQPEPGPAVQLDWVRFASEDVDDDPFVNSGRYLILLDTFGWPAAGRAHVKDPRFIAPSLALTVDFHRSHSEAWMLSEATAPLSCRGYIKAHNRLWSESGELIASGSVTMMCRPRPGIAS